jgi:hypothetical protein
MSTLNHGVTAVLTNVSHTINSNNWSLSSTAIVRPLRQPHTNTFDSSRVIQQLVMTGHHAGMTGRWRGAYGSPENDDGTNSVRGQTLSDTCVPFFSLLCVLTDTEELFNCLVSPVQFWTKPNRAKQREVSAFRRLLNSSVMILRHSEHVPIQPEPSDREKHLSHPRSYVYPVNRRS